eukprot:7021680-Alexandrium_andersonii.AAC.1
MVLLPEQMFFPFPFRRFALRDARTDRRPDGHAVPKQRGRPRTWAAELIHTIWRSAFQRGAYEH